MSSLPTYVEPIHIVTVTLITGDSVDGELATPFRGRRGGSMSVTSSPSSFGPRSLKRPPKGDRRRRRRRGSKRTSKTKSRRHNSVPVSQRVDTLHTRSKSNDLPVHLQFLLTPEQRRQFENSIFREELTLAFLKFGEFIVRFDGLFVSVSRGDRTKQALKHLEKRLGLLWTRAMVNDVLKKIREDTAGEEGGFRDATGASSIGDKSVDKSDDKKRSSLMKADVSDVDDRGIVPELEKAKSFGDEELEVSEFLARIGRTYSEGTAMVKHRRHKPSSKVWMKAGHSHLVLVSSADSDANSARTGLTLKRIKAVFDGAKAKQLFDSSDGRTLHTSSAGGPRLSTVDPSVCLVIAGDRTTLRLQTETADTARFIKHSLRAMVKHARMVLGRRDDRSEERAGSDADDEDEDVEGDAPAEDHREDSLSLSKGARLPDMLTSPMVTSSSSMSGVCGTMTEAAFGTALAELSLYPSDVETDLDKLSGYDSSDKEELSHTFSERRSGTARGMRGPRELTESSGFNDKKLEKSTISVMFWLTDKQLTCMETREARSTLVVFSQHFGQFRTDYRMKEMEVLFESRRLHTKGVQILENRLGVLWEQSEIKLMVRKFVELQNKLPDRKILIEGEPVDDEEGGQSAEEDDLLDQGEPTVSYHRKSSQTVIELAGGRGSIHSDTSRKDSATLAGDHGSEFSFSLKRELIQYRGFFDHVIRQLEYGSRYYDYSARDGSVKQGLLYMRDMVLFHASTTISRSSIINVDTTITEEDDDMGEEDEGPPMSMTMDSGPPSIERGLSSEGTPVSMEFPDTVVMHAPSLAAASMSVTSGSVTPFSPGSYAVGSLDTVKEASVSVDTPSEVGMPAEPLSKLSSKSETTTTLSSIDLSQVLTMQEEKTCSLWDRIDTLLIEREKETPLRSRCFAVVARDRTLLCEMESSRSAHLWYSALESLFNHVGQYGPIAGPH